MALHVEASDRQACFGQDWLDSSKRWVAHGIMKRSMACVWRSVLTVGVILSCVDAVIYSQSKCLDVVNNGCIVDHISYDGTCAEITQFYAGFLAQASHCSTLGDVVTAPSLRCTVVCSTPLQRSRTGPWLARICKT